MRFLFITIQGFESDFYGRVGANLGALGHEVQHLTASRLAARRLRHAGHEATALQEILGQPSADAKQRIERDYGSLVGLYATDPASDRLLPNAASARTVAHVLAVEKMFDRAQPDVIVPEVGRELIRTVAHRVALKRNVRTFFLFYTIFPQALRLYEDTMQRPIVPHENVRTLTSDERSEIERFRETFVARDAPIRPHRALGLTARRLRRFVSYGIARLGADRDNEYLHPVHWAAEVIVGALRADRARKLYRHVVPGQRYVYFPLHDAADYKIRALVPHLADQQDVARKLAAALPDGVELVVKEHPQSIGRNPLHWLREVASIPGVRLVPPRTSTHDLIAGADGVAVISSTVGLEALLHGKPVLTLGEPFYSGYGVTVDVDGLDDAQRGIAALMTFAPDRKRTLELLHAAMRACLPGAPVLVDESDANAAALAQSLDQAARGID